MNPTHDSRRTRIEEMLKAQPHDVFLRYALALELDKAGEHDAALTLFKELMASPDNYVPAYFMAGQMLTRLGRAIEAGEILRAGIEQANKQGDQHAANEMSGFLTMIEE
ncbi:MAG TPA: hypothetical protein PKD64_18755 [Pirellulaceae bacterium]|nr:hypothetical protein [Pirellulaceae bacterium]HMO94231.1 hypothetical protein [Pirellulaceae bacterium]HMP71267.1 hypothetical protein [Pirellulaceae bacterium]